MHAAESLPGNKEAYKIFNSTTALSEAEAGKHSVWLYLYRSWQSSKPQLVAHRELATLPYFATADNFRKLPPLKAKESKNDTRPVQQGSPPPTEILHISRKQIFVTPEYPAGSAKDPFKKETIEQELKARLQKKSYPDQEGTSLCGPAAYFYCLLRDRPDLYREAVKSLWETGEARVQSLNIKAGKAAKPHNFFKNNKESRISGIDWISMGSLRNSENFFWDYDDTNAQTAAFTLPVELAKWLKESGAANLQNLTTVFSSSLAELVKINEYAKRGYRVVQLISSPNIFKGAVTPNFKAHWIVWESPLCDAQTGSYIDLHSRLDSKVNLRLFTWGKVTQLVKYDDGIYTKNITLKKFLDACFGAIVFSGI